MRLLSISIALALAVGGWTGRSLWAVETAPRAPKAPRPLAAGVETPVPRDQRAEETVDAHDLIELTKGVPDLAWTPEQGETTETLRYKATNTLFRRGVWQFQFSFRPLRLLRLDMPGPNGQMERKIIWYMVYRITNPGQHMTPVQGSESKTEQYEAWHKGLYTVERVNTAGQMLANAGPHRFIPIFKLQSHDPETRGKEWLDQIVPLAKEAIYRREQPPCPIEEFYNTVEIADFKDKKDNNKAGIPLSIGRIDRPVWGYVTWIGGVPPKPAANEIDPRLDFFSIYIWGLTNAYRWQDVPGAYKPGDPPGKGRRMEQKVLRLNFSRLGDEYLQREEEIKLGIQGQLDWEWVYR